MFKFLRTFFKPAFFGMLVFAPFSGICQITIPTWVKGIGGSGSDCVSAAVKTDAQNNVYVTGDFTGTVDFDPGEGEYNITAAAAKDVYVAKYNTAGNLIWAVSLGGNSNDLASSLTVDTDGNLIITGQYSSSDFDADPGAGSNIFASLGNRDAFVIKLTTNGSFMWAKTIGGLGDDYGGRVSVDSQGNMVTTISFHSTVNVDGNIFTSQGGFNGLAIKYSAAGNLIWAINLSDSAECEVGYGDFDHEGNFVMCGTFTGNVNFNPLGAATLLNGNGNATFIAKYTSQGQLIWAKPVYGQVYPNYSNLCINSKNEIFLAGTAVSALNFGSITLNPVSVTNVYLAKYTPEGELMAAKLIAGTSGSVVVNNGIVCSADDNIYLSGYFNGTIDFNTSPNQEQFKAYHGGRDFFLAKYDEDLNYKLAFAEGNSDCLNSTGRNLAIDNNNDLIFTGGFCSSVNFSASLCRPSILFASGNTDTFLAKYPQYEAPSQGRITGFTIPQQVKPTVIDDQKLKITVTVPAGSDITSLTPTISYNTDLALNPNSRRAQKFTVPVIYTLSTSCYSLNYVAEVVFSDDVTEKQDTVCNGNETILTGDVLSAEPDSYAWEVLRTNTWANPPGPQPFDRKDYRTGSLTNDGNENRIVNVRRKVVSGGVTSYDSYYAVTVLPEISDNTIATPVNEVFCGSKDIDMIQGSAPTGGDGTYTYQWQSSPTGSINEWNNIDGAVSQNYDPPVVSNTIHYRRVIIACGQDLSSNTIHYYIQPKPPVPVVQNDTICAGNSATLTVDVLPGITVKWYLNATGGNSISTANTLITPQLNTNITFYVEAVTENDCASARTPVSVIMAQPLPAPVVTVGKITLNSIVFNWTAVAGATGYEVSINGGAFAGVGDVLTYTAGSLTVGQTVSLSVRATGVLSCELGSNSATVTGSAITSAINQIFVPNVFSPNGDGSNDVLYVRSEGIKSLLLYVYNQWGEMIFRSVNQSAGWDGTYKGSLLPIGVYVYYVEATMLDGSKINKKGTVTLIL